MVVYELTWCYDKGRIWEQTRRSLVNKNMAEINLKENLENNSPKK